MNIADKEAFMKVQEMVKCPTIDDAREKLLYAFDRCQDAHGALESAQIQLEDQKAFVAHLRDAYKSAMRNWEMVLAEVTPGPKSQEPTFEEHGG